MFFEYNVGVLLSYSQSSVLGMKPFIEIIIKYKNIEFPFTYFTIFVTYYNISNNVI
jgi:hypothetical protein